MIYDNQHALKNEFYQRVQERGAASEVETRLRATITKLKKTIANKNTELAQLRADVPVLVRVVHQLTLENQQPRDALTNPGANIISFPGHPAPRHKGPITAEDGPGHCHL